MTLKILLLGTKRENQPLEAICTQYGHTVYSFPEEEGTHSLPSQWVGIDLHMHGEIADFAEQMGVDFTIVNSPKALKAGIANVFHSRFLPIFGPTQQGNLLESNYLFAKQFLQRHQIPTAKFAVCHSEKEGVESAQKLLLTASSIIIRQAGPLLQNKNRPACQTVDQAKKILHALMRVNPYKPPPREILIEESLTGEKTSLFALTDGTHCLPLFPKKAQSTQNDKYVRHSTHFQEKEWVENFLRPTLQGLAQERIPYTGVLGLHIVWTEKGPFLAHYFCRFGEGAATQLLSLLDNGTIEYMRSAAKQPLCCNPQETAHSSL